MFIYSADGLDRVLVPVDPEDAACDEVLYIRDGWDSKMTRRRRRPHRRYSCGPVASRCVCGLCWRPWRTR
jgi:hypothetical protein